MIFNDKLVMTDCDAENAQQVISALCALMEWQGMVKSSYCEAVLAREKEYPTGIPTEFYDVAIPHAPSGHVLKPGIAIAQLQKPVPFFSMGDREEELAAQIVILLAIQDPQAQLHLLKSLLGSFESEQTMQALRSAKSAQEIVQVITSLGITEADG